MSLQSAAQYLARYREHGADGLALAVERALVYCDGLAPDGRPSREHPGSAGRNVRLWNSWTPARHKRAHAEPAASGFVVEAKRARAGRTLFAPAAGRT